MDLSPGMLTLVIVGLVLLLILSSLWIGFALILASFILFILFGETRIMGMLAQAQFNVANSWVLAAVPLFVFMGELLVRSGLSDKVYMGASRIMAPFPGGILPSNVLGSTMFGAVSGSPTATAATIGTIAIPEQLARGYSPRLVLGSVAGSGGLGALIPPSIMMIIYGSLVNQPVGRLFVAGVFPGLMLCSLFIMYLMITCLVRPTLTPQREKFSKDYIRALLSSMRDLWPFMILSLFILGSIYAGFATPTEAAAVAVVMTMVMAACYRRLTLRLLWESARNTVRTTSFVILLLLGGYILGYGIAMTRLPVTLSEWITSAGLPFLVVWIAIILFYIILGMFVDSITMLVITLPIIYPVAVDTLGFSPIWFGVVCVILHNIAMITPPVGLLLYLVQGLSGKNLSDVMIGSIPYVILMIIGLVALTVFPQIALWLPNTMFETLYH